MDAEVKKGQSTEQVQQSSEDETGARKGTWSVEEDTILVNYVSTHGEGRWNSLARSAGLKRSGKSCRLRWLNYLRPGVRRGNITLQEQMTILDLYSRWGNRWSKIAQHLVGRTDNEIKNYWRTRVVKKAKQLKCDVDSKQFKDALRYVWMPLLIERIQPPAETHYPTHITHDAQLDPNPNPSPSASAARVLVHHQHGLQSSGSGTEWVNQAYSSCGSGASPASSGVELQVVHSEQLGHDASGPCPGFNNQMLEPGNTTLPFNNQMLEPGNTTLPFGGGGGGGDFDLLLDSSWNEENILPMRQLWDDLEIKDNFLA